MFVLEEQEKLLCVMCDKSKLGLFLAFEGFVICEECLDKHDLCLEPVDEDKDYDEEEGEYVCENCQ